MQTQIDNAFASLNARLFETDRAFAVAKVEGEKGAVEKAREEFAAGSDRHAIYYANGNRRFDSGLAKIDWFGSKSMMNLLCGRGLAGAIEAMEKNTAKLIEKRDAQIIKALTKAGVTELPEFKLVEVSDGLEGVFFVAGKRVTIRTILAGGYNIQRLHNRTLVKVK